MNNLGLSLKNVDIVLFLCLTATSLGGEISFDQEADPSWPTN